MNTRLIARRRFCPVLEGLSGLHSRRRPQGHLWERLTTCLLRGLAGGPWMPCTPVPAAGRPAAPADGVASATLHPPFVPGRQDGDAPSPAGAGDLCARASGPPRYGRWRFAALVWAPSRARLHGLCACAFPALGGAAGDGMLSMPSILGRPADHLAERCAVFVPNLGHLPDRLGRRVRLARVRDTWAGGSRLCTLEREHDTATAGDVLAGCWPLAGLFPLPAAPSASSARTCVRGNAAVSRLPALANTNLFSDERFTGPCRTAWTALLRHAARRPMSANPSVGPPGATGLGIADRGRQAHMAGRRRAP